LYVVVVAFTFGLRLVWLICCCCWLLVTRLRFVGYVVCYVTVALVTLVICCWLRSPLLVTFAVVGLLTFGWLRLLLRLRWLFWLRCWLRLRLRLPRFTLVTFGYTLLRYGLVGYVCCYAVAVGCYVVRCYVHVWLVTFCWLRLVGCVVVWLFGCYVGWLVVGCLRWLRLVVTVTFGFGLRFVVYVYVCVATLRLVLRLVVGCCTLRLLTFAVGYVAGCYVDTFGWLRCTC